MSVDALQRAFAAHIRNPERVPVPADVEPRRMRIYEELVHNTVEGFISSGFPVLRSLLEDAAWQAMVRLFVDMHRCQTPYFLKISEEFIGFLERRPPLEGMPPFALELAHYEWVELALDVAEDEIGDAALERDGDLLDGVPVLSPLAWGLSYSYPVHRISADFQPEQPPAEPTRLIVYRNREDAVKFIETNAVTLRMLELIEDERMSGRELLAAIAAELGRPGDAGVLAAGAETLERLRQLDVVAGVRGDRAVMA